MKDSELSTTIEALVTPFVDRTGGLLQALHAIQARFHCIPEACVPLVAEQFNLSRAEVHGTLSFYPNFHAHPTGDHTVILCRAESCQAMGSGQLETVARDTLGIEFEQTTADGKVSLHEAYCLGLCACSPAVSINGKPHARVSPEQLKALLEEVQS